MLHTFLTLLFILFLLPNAIAGTNGAPARVDVRQQVLQSLTIDPDEEGSERIRLEAHELPGGTGEQGAKGGAGVPSASLTADERSSSPPSRADSSHLPVPEKTITIRSLEDVFDLDQELDDAHERSRDRAR